MGFRILLTEGASPLGAVLHRHFELLALAVVCPEPGAVDWCNKAAVERLLEQVQPAVIINTLMWADGTWANGEPDPCLYRNLAAVCRALNQTVIHLSSHEVFATGYQDSPRIETDFPEPDSPKGRALVDAEQAFLDVDRCLVVRLPWIVDLPGGLLEQVCTGLVLADSPLQVAENWRGSPVMLDDCARVLVAIVQQMLCGAENWGVVHFRSSDACSEAEYAEYIGRVLRKAGCSTNDLTTVPFEERLVPTNGWLAGQRCTNNFGIQLRSWRQGVKHWLREWLESQVAQQRVTLEEPKKKEVTLPVNAARR